MPNHFHLMVHTKKDFNRPLFTTDFRLLLSSYTRAINKQEGRVGSLFQQKSKMKALNGDDNKHSSYPFICFHYIHQNPVKARLVRKMEDYPYSSYKEYLDEKSLLCNKAIAYELLGIPRQKDEFLKESIKVQDIRPFSD